MVSDKPGLFLASLLLYCVPGVPLLVLAGGLARWLRRWPWSGVGSLLFVFVPPLLAGFLCMVFWQRPKSLTNMLEAAIYGTEAGVACLLVAAATAGRPNPWIVGAGALVACAAVVFTYATVSVFPG